MTAFSPAVDNEHVIDATTFDGVDDGWFRVMFDASTVPIGLADEDGLLRAANAAYCAMVGRSWPQIAGRSSREFTHPDDLDQHAAVEGLMAQARARGDDLRIEKRYVHPDGTVRWGWVSVSAVSGPGGRAWTMAVIHDTTERRLAEDRLLAAAVTDPLTGLLNRRGWLERLTELDAPSSRTDSPLVLAILDLDQFKAYNDSHGHPAGDQLLVEFATAASEVAGTGALFSRWGGEEFALALAGPRASQAHTVLRAMGAVVPDSQTFSAGFAALRATETVIGCFDRADARLYRAKRDGPGQIRGDDN
ncbi:PAS domain S-box-containing protein/diguanylate cyclase (GGDEF) domain-containing protein [Williamsia maris]|uniref:PAS domain S-box-containing protein/diguanylate cyclase (GGDEF) domain-containing protein n=1 Tax=Williamsia maris TaxID=72806 RepID=A0ABT1HAW1_9NOCA|nr:PAS domain S-box-containing protein/diguanylate cyclase (GGDEF) domain-containing protein [Williamsia maris]